MGLKRKHPKARPTDDAGEVKVEVDLLTGAMRVDPGKLLRSKATQDLLREAECIETQIMKQRSGSNAICLRRPTTDW